MFLAIFPFFASPQYVIFLCASCEVQFSNIQHFVVFTVFARKTGSQNEPGQLIGDDTFSKFMPFLFTLLRLKCRKMEAHVRDWTFVCLKRPFVIINDDYFGEGECYWQALSPIYLHKVDFA